MTKFNHGDYVTCTIDNTNIEDARISIDKNGDVFICQNERDGVSANDKLGYKYSWHIEDDGTGDDVTNLRLASREYKVGDVLIDRTGQKIKIKRSTTQYLSEQGDWYGQKILDETGYSLYTPELIEVNGKKYLKSDIEKLTPQ